MKLFLSCITNDDAIFYERIKQKKNKLFKFENQKFYFSFQGKWKKLDLIYLKDSNNNDYFVNLIYKFIDESHKRVIKNNYKNNSKSKENFDFQYDFNPQEVKKYVELWLNTLEYDNKFDIINLCCWIPYNLLAKHFWINGNKRTALVTCINLLKFFNLYLSYSKDDGLTKDGENRWYTIFVSYVCDIEQNKNRFKEIYKKFYNEITKGIFFNVNKIEE